VVAVGFDFGDEDLRLSIEKCTNHYLAIAITIERYLELVGTVLKDCDRYEKIDRLQGY